ncbi:Histidinol-phosphate aminotransferase [Bathymodiolus heckerae thiotrophic gill symbiont]|uniref:histidinol-phosphate transaminase n=1 Tax=Bathymodiolus heckerae thiotrophic gill symbiont TaxID=1052212 RepID=UPI0010BBFD55|nr:histidinol-phosphate transaminase [Bathymodiolus heckerae thiotrophic gill symbiont]CAC9437249.1 Histidinol-phosphate aminotransferase (EC 2.6.1.9) [uncultured Gammaproteobacteria bacterium]SMN14073.1 Histidinol-phosphate aminotransferase [Bathymodiolus heckerae thiotrophic gill symbiont]
MNNFISNWLRPDIKAINAYHVPPSDDMVKLDAMESPFPLPDALIEQYLAYLANVELNRYPSPNASELQQTLYQLMDIPADFGMLLGNGSDELIQLLALACDTGDSILSVEPSFVMYQIIAKFTRLNYHGVELNENFEIDLPAMLLAIETHQPKLIFIAYPNNPTGNTFDRAAIEQIITSTSAMVVLDEAYYAYADDSFLGDIAKYPNLVLLRTVSKIGFAGLRLGLLIGTQDTVAALDKLRLPYNINTLTQVSANFLLKEKDEINKNAQIILKQRTKLSSALDAINGLQVYPSQANFLLFKAPSAHKLFAFLKANGVLIKDLSTAPKLTDCLRVTVGNAEQNQHFINLVKCFYD